MEWTLERWKQATGRKLQETQQWLKRRGQDAPLLVYGTVAGLSLWPVVEAAALHGGDPKMLLAAAYGTAAGVGANLLADQLKAWKEQAEPPDETAVVEWVSEQVAGNSSLCEAVDEVLQKLGAMAAAQEVFPAQEQKEFLTRLLYETAKLGNLERFIVVGERGVYVAGNVHGPVITGDNNVYEVINNYFAHRPRPQYTAPPLPKPDELAPHAPLPPGSYLSHQRNPLFTGRSPQLLTLAKALLYEQGDVVVTQTAVASGLGGIGKTQLAVEFAHRYGQYFAGGVYWLNCDNPANIPTEIALIGGQRGMGLYQEGEGLTPDEQVGLVQQAWLEATPRLLIFDNCEEEAILKQWRPVSGGCRVLVTSRRGTWAGSLGVRPFPLDVLERPESLALLRRFVPTLSDQEANDIAAELGDLPLALHLAGSYLKEYAAVVSAAGYLKELKKLQGQGLLNHSSLQGRGAEPSPTGHELHVALTFALSYERLEPQDETDEAARFLLACAACFAPGEAFPGDWLLAALESDDELLPVDGRKRLLALGLLAADGESGYQLHRLLAVYVRQVLGEVMEGARPAVERAVDKEAWALNAAGYPAALLPWQSQLRYMTEKAEARNSPEAHELLMTLGYHLWMLGDYAEAKGSYERALALREQALGPHHPDTATSLNNLAELLRAMGDLAAARPLYEQALAIREQALGPDHPDTAQSLNNLASLLYTMGDLAAARPLYERALAIWEQALGPDHPHTGISAGNLAGVLEVMGELAAARPYRERALTIHEQALGPHHPDTATSLNNLAGLLYTMGDLAAARPLFERALALREQALGPGHPDTAQSLNNLAALLQAMGDLAAARPLYERALATTEQALGPNHPTTAIRLNNLGSLLQDMGDLAAARPFFERALAIWEQALGPNHPDTAYSLNNLAGLLYAMGNLATARPLFERALAISDQALGPHHPQTATSLNNLAGLLQEMGDLAAARPLYERALAILEKVLGPEHPHTQMARDNLAQLQMREMLNLLAGGEGEGLEAMELLRRMFGGDDGE